MSANDDIIEDSYLNQDGTFKHLDHYWRRVFSLKTLSGSPRHPLLSIALKTCCSLQKVISATGIYISFSGNKNTLTKERTILGEENVKAFTLSKEFVRLSDGVHKMIVTPEMHNHYLMHTIHANPGREMKR